MPNPAFETKPENNVIVRQRIQRLRDDLPCVCGHKNVSHGYGREVGSFSWPDGSRIGGGECGMCECRTFAPSSDLRENT